MAANAIELDLLRSIAYSSILSSYVPIGTPFTHSLRTTCCVNNTDADMFVSDDGVNAKWFLPAYSFRLYDLAANSGPSSNARLPANKQFSVAYATVAPTKGSVYMEASYGLGE